ncbi:hypothetical protein LG329_06945 [Virgibacillus necropolis]|uniref:hypothetical protein n=1 Tax=Virgibacillus necropolis TaxID=163877 RepID=UPI00384FE99D
MTKITEHKAFKALNKPDSLYGHYQVSHDTRIFVKYLMKPTFSWSFQFNVNELQAIGTDLNKAENVYLCLVCGEETICELDYEDFSGLIDVNAIERQKIVVEVPAGGSMHIKGSTGSLPNVVHHNSFPEKLFEERMIVQWFLGAIHFLNNSTESSAKC